MKSKLLKYIKNERFFTGNNYFIFTWGAPPNEKKGLSRYRDIEHIEYDFRVKNK